MAWSKHGFRPIRAHVIYMLSYKSVSSLKNTRRTSTFRAKALPWEPTVFYDYYNFPTKGLRSKRQSSPCIFQVVTCTDLLAQWLHPHQSELLLWLALPSKITSSLNLRNTEDISRPMHIRLNPFVIFSLPFFDKYSHIVRFSFREMAVFRLFWYYYYRPNASNVGCTVVFGISRGIVCGWIVIYNTWLGLKGKNIKVLLTAWRMAMLVLIL
jgi:hypothetical protein